MKKLLLTLYVLLCYAINAKAQLYIGGTAGASYSNETFMGIFEPMVGYEFNRRWAVGSGFGLGVAEEKCYGIVEPFVRFTACNKGNLFWDVKCNGLFGISEGELFYSEIGISPSLRVKLSEHFFISGDLGFFGVGGYDGEWTPMIGIVPYNTNISVIYCF